MPWITLLFLAVGVAIMIMQYRSSQTSAVVAVEHQVPVPTDELRSIEYFWRPG